MELARQPRVLESQLHVRSEGRFSANLGSKPTRTIRVAEDDASGWSKSDTWISLTAAADGQRIGRVRQRGSFGFSPLHYYETLTKNVFPTFLLTPAGRRC